MNSLITILGASKQKDPCHVGARFTCGPPLARVTDVMNACCAELGDKKGNKRKALLPAVTPPDSVAITALY